MLDWGVCCADVEWQTQGARKPGHKRHCTTVHCRVVAGYCDTGINDSEQQHTAAHPAARALLLGRKATHWTAARWPLSTYRGSGGGGGILT